MKIKHIRNHHLLELLVNWSNFANDLLYQHGFLIPTIHWTWGGLPTEDFAKVSTIWVWLKIKGRPSQPSPLFWDTNRNVLEIWCPHKPKSWVCLRTRLLPNTVIPDKVVANVVTCCNLRKYRLISHLSMETERQKTNLSHPTGTFGGGG